jgi:hypothetical protein
MPPPFLRTSSRGESTCCETSRGARSRALNLLAFGYALPVVSAAGMKPGLVGIRVVVEVLTVALEVSVSVEITVTTAVDVWVMSTVDVVEKTSVTAEFIVVTVT